MRSEAHEVYATFNSTVKMILWIFMEKRDNFEKRKLLLNKFVTFSVIVGDQG